MYPVSFYSWRKKNPLSTGFRYLAKTHGDNQETIHQRQRPLLFVPDLYRNNEPLLYTRHVQWTHLATGAAQNAFCFILSVVRTQEVTYFLFGIYKGLLNISRGGFVWGRCADKPSSDAISCQGEKTTKQNFRTTKSGFSQIFGGATFCQWE